jgi:L-lysine 2,3-aminomutase
VTLLNQTVLLAGINDSVDALADLSETLFDAGVLPYYLHMLDPVEGAAHFDVSNDEAKCLHAKLSARLPGYLVPRLVREVPGAPAKVGVDLWR